jgi:hypothetical protein
MDHRTLTRSVLVGVTLAAANLAAAQEPDTPSPFRSAEQTPADAAPSPILFAQSPRPSVSITSSRTHPRSGTLDAGGQRRMLSTLLEAELQLRDGSTAGRIRDLVLGPDGAVEYFVIGDGDEERTLVPFEAVTLSTDGKTVELPLTAAEFAERPVYHGELPDLSSLDVRWKLLAAFGLGEVNSRVPPPPPAVRSLPRPATVSETATTESTSAPVASERSGLTFSGVPVESNYAGTPAITGPTRRTQIVNPAPNLIINPTQQYAPTTTPMNVGPTAIIPSRAAVNATNRLDAAANRAANRLTPGQTTGGVNAGTVGGARAGTPGGTPPSTLPPGHVSGGASTIGGYSPGQGGGIRPTSPGGPAPTYSRPQGNPAPPAPPGSPGTGGTSTTTSPSGTNPPPRVP